jgi:aldehyde dehydrogenase (NAD+)
LQKFTEKIENLKVGDPFDNANYQGAQVSQQQYDVRSILLYHTEQRSIDSLAYYLQRIMGYIQSGKSEGATCHIGGERHGTEGYFIQPTVFTDCKPDMKIVREEIFGPVGVIIKFDDDEDVIRQANDTTYGLASSIFSQNINRAIKTANRLHAGTVWVRSYH